jgi:enterochelin esterase-like enzyme
MYMMRSTLCLIIMAISVCAVSSQSGGVVIESLTLESEILNMERKYAVYLPPDYELSDRFYPVLYLLHGGGDDHTGWVQFGEVKGITDRAISEGTATPMIIVMPDAQTGQRGYLNSIQGDWRFEDFFFDEFMPHVENQFRIRKQKRYRAISGLSMGGGGSFLYAMHRPDLFIASCPLSAYAGPLSVDQLRQRLERSGPVNLSDVDLSDYFDKHSAAALAESMDPEALSSVKWFIDCGDDDFLYEGNSLIHIAFKKKDVPHEYRVRDGGHTWTYWRASLPDVLSFISGYFHQQ